MTINRYANSQIGELNKSITKLTAQNTQAAKDLQEAKDKARDLERKLS